MLDVDSSDIDVDDEMEMSSGMLSFMSPTKRDSLDEGYDPNETLKVIVYEGEGDEGNKIEIRPSTFGDVDDDDDDDVSHNVIDGGGVTDDDDVQVEQMTVSSAEPRENVDYDSEVVSTDRQTVAEEEEGSEELGSQETYIYPTKFGFFREYEASSEGEEVEKDKPIAIKRIPIADPEPQPFPVPMKRGSMQIPGPPQYLTRTQVLDIPKIQVTEDEGQSEPKKSRRGRFPIPDPVAYFRRDEKPEVLHVEIHHEPTEIQTKDEDVVDSKRPARHSRVTFNIPEPVEYVERPEVQTRKLVKKFDDVSDEEISDRDDASGARTSDSEAEEPTERKRFRPVTARTRVTSPLPDPVNYLSRRESELSCLSDALKDGQETDRQPSDTIQVQSDAVPMTSPSVTFKPKIPGPVIYMTREEKLARLKKIANSGSVDSDTKVFNEIMRAVEASHVSIDSDDVYREIVKAFHVPQISVDSNDVYNEIMAALRFDENDAILASVPEDHVDLLPPEILSFQDFISSSTYSTKAPTESPETVRDATDAKVEKLDAGGDESSAKETETDTKTTDSIDIPENPVPSPVHYPSSKIMFDESTFTPIMVDGKIRKASAKSLSKLRQHCSSRAHPCDCNDV